MSKKLSVKLGIFGGCPISLLQDKSVKPNAVKVFIALMSFEGTGVESYPSREQIAERAGLSTPEKVSNAIQNLVETGWVNVIQRGKKQSNIYQCIIQGDMPESGTVPKSGMPESGTSDVPKTGTGDMPESGTSIVKDQFKRPLKRPLSPVGDQPQPPAIVTKTKAESLHHQTIDFISRVHHKVHGSPVVIDPKEAAHVRQIIKLAEAEDHDNPKAVIERRLRICLRKMETATTDYWADFKFTPSKIRSRWNELTPDLPKMTNAEKAIRENELRVNDIPAPEAADSVEEKNRRELLAMLEEAESNVSA